MYDDLGIPDVVLGVYDWVIAWDHQQRRAWLISTGLPATGREERAVRARARASAVRERLQSPVPETPAARPPHDHGARGPAPPTFAVDGHPGLRSSYPHDGYLAAVARVRDYIIAGDIFQANLSQRLEAEYAGDPWSLYRKLRAINPAPFAAYFEAPGLAVVSASPERFIQVSVDGAVETRPIKGTSPRGIGPEHDAHLGRALIESEKDRAENLMIVDLLRNDLSRVCVPGSVRVPELFALEHYSTVHHLVSTVVGHLAPWADAIGLLRAAFPGGSITGAPKVRAMEIIAELEPSRRGVYCGTVAYVSLTGAADSSIVIRTYLARRGRVYFSVGGGIVADSDPEAEYRETLDKARALITALP
jgi:para-aminobenzoate synthetase component 1